MPSADYKPVPFTDLLAELRRRGLSIGVREHLAVGHLLDRWDGDDSAELESALAALLSFNAEQAQTVRDVFAMLYLQPAGDESADAQSMPIPVKRGWFRRYWPGLAIALLLVGTAAYVGGKDIPEGADGPPRPSEVPPEVTIQPPELGSALPSPPPQPNYFRGLAVASIAGLLVFGVGYVARTRRKSLRLGRRLLSGEADKLGGAEDYEFEPSGLRSAFDAALLDDTGMLLARRSAERSRRNIDIDASVKLTVDAGLAPHIVFAMTSPTLPLVVLEDTGREMRNHRHAVRSLLDGLSSRGVAIEHWQFDEDASMVFRPGSSSAVSLSRLCRERGHSPLLVISTGDGAIEHPDCAPAAWTKQLDTWLSRGWLNPVTDVERWRPALWEIDTSVWPMTPNGILACGRHLASGEADLPPSEIRIVDDAVRVSPVDVQRLAAMLALAPRRSPELGEALRQRFCPWVPGAGVADAIRVDTPTMATIGPPNDVVRRFLLTILDESPPERGTAARYRWRLDKALLSIGIEDKEADGFADLEALADSPVASDVQAYLESDAANNNSQIATLARPVLRNVRGRARHWALNSKGAWKSLGLPGLHETLAALLVLAGVTAATPYLGSSFEYNVNSVQHAYSMSVSGQGPFVFRVSPLESFTRFHEAVPEAVDLYRGDRVVRNNVPVDGDGVRYDDQEDGAWFWVAATLPSGANAVSETQWVATAAAPQGFVQVVNFPDGAAPQDLTIDSDSWDGSADPMPVAPGSIAIAFSHSTLGDFATTLDVAQNATTTLDVRSLLPRQAEVTSVTPSVIYVNSSTSITVRGSNLDLVSDIRFAGGDIALFDDDGNRTTKPVRQSAGALDFLAMTPDPERTKPGNRNLILDLTDGGRVVVPDAVRIETRATNEGFISVRNYPDGASSQRLSLNGERWGGEDPVTVTPGRVTIEFDGGASSFSTSVVARANETTTVNFASLQQSQAVSIRSVSPQTLYLESSARLTILGANLDRVRSVQIQDFEIRSFQYIEAESKQAATRDLDQIQVGVTALEIAEPGPRDLVLRLSDGRPVTSRRALQVVEPEQTVPRQQEEIRRISESEILSATLDEINLYLSDNNILVDVLFERDRSRLMPEAQSGLDRDAQFLLSYPDLVVAVTGHDEQRNTRLTVEAARERSMAISERRAQAVVDYLVAMGVSSSQLRVVNRGADLGVCSEQMEECHQRNRRVSFAVADKVQRPRPPTFD